MPSRRLQGHGILSLQLPHQTKRVSYLNPLKLQRKQDALKVVSWPESHLNHNEPASQKMHRRTRAGPRFHPQRSMTNFLNDAILNETLMKHVRLSVLLVGLAALSDLHTAEIPNQILSEDFIKDLAQILSSVNSVHVRTKHDSA